MQLIMNSSVPGIGFVAGFFIQPNLRVAWQVACYAWFLDVLKDCEEVEVDPLYYRSGRLEELFGVGADLRLSADIKAAVGT